MSAGAGGRAPRRVAVWVALGVVAAASIAVGAFVAVNNGMDAAAQSSPSPAVTPTPTPTATPTPMPTPLTASEELLATTDDPAACAVSFDGDGIVEPPVLQTQGALYSGLPIPDREGAVFAGWYATPADAAARAIAGRLNGSEPVECTDRERTLYGSWTTPEANVAENARIPILMYHQFTKRPEGEDGWLRGNWAYIGDFDAQMDHIATGGFYLPTWDELSAFIDGRLWLPNHSVIITDDDCDFSWLRLGLPVVVEKHLLTTAFCITIDGTGPSPSIYVQQRSHTHDMHRGGADGQGRMVSLPIADIVADMEASAAVLGVKQVMAYPFGHYNETAKEALRQAGWDLARTIEPGYVSIGTDKLALPTVRIDYGMGLGDLISLIG